MFVPRKIYVHKQFYSQSVRCLTLRCQLSFENPLWVPVVIKYYVRMYEPDGCFHLYT